MATVGIKRLMF